MADGDEQLIASASDDPAGALDADPPEERALVDLPLLWSSMDLPGMEEGGE